MKINCPNCQATGKIGDEWLGKNIKCPKCKESFTVEPAAEVEQPVAPPREDAPRKSVPPPVKRAKAVCSQCNMPALKSELANFDGTLVCARCKGVYLQQIKEGVSNSNIDFEYAGIWPRWGAKIIDGLLTSLVTYLIGLLFGVVAGMMNLDPVVMGLIAQFVGIAFGMAYVTWFLGKHGATPGKMALGLKVVKPDGMGLTYPQAFGRYWAEMLSGIILGIGYLMAAFDDEKRTLHDRICGTRVIRDR